MTTDTQSRVVKREIRMARTTDLKLRELAERWRTNGTGEVITLLVAMYESDAPPKRNDSRATMAR